MRIFKMKLNKKNIDAIKPPASGKRFYWDDTISGFGLAVWPSGTKTFIYQDRIKGRKRRITIDRYGNITPTQARARAQHLAGQIASGIDPVAEKHERVVESLTLREALEGYIENRQLKPGTLKDISVAMKSFSDWMKKPIITITRDAVARRHKKLGEKSEARANLSMRYLRAILNYASEANAYPDGSPLLKDNPVTRLSATKSWFKVGRRKNYLYEHEIKPWMQAVLRLPEVPDREPAKGKHKPKLRHGDLARDFFLILILTGLRRSEVLGLTWDNVDLVGKTLTIPDPKNREPHTLPLSDYLHEILSERKEKSGGSYVLSGPDGKKFQAFRYAQARIEEDTGIKISPHDLRRTFATVAESLNIPAYAVKGLLNHKTTGDITAGYIQITVERLRDPMQKITDHFLLRGGIKGGKVIELRRGAI
jgi:integrase